MDIQGEGGFLIAKKSGTSTMIVRSPKPGDFEDLVIPPHKEVTVDEAWLKVPYFVRDVDAGKIELRRSDTFPVETPWTVAQEFEGQLEDGQKQLAKTICELPLSEQYLSAIHIGELVNDQGIPRQGARVTKSYLVEKHLPFLKATLALEGRWQKRKKVTDELKRAIKRIEAL